MKILIYILILLFASILLPFVALNAIAGFKLFFLPESSETGEERSRSYKSLTIGVGFLLIFIFIVWFLFLIFRYLNYS